MPGSVTPATTRYVSVRPDGRLQCDVCPRRCRLQPGQRGLCFVRERVQDEIVLSTYGLSSGLCIDPIEKKPLHHFLPGTPVLSLGTAGCNLACKFCQNWDISKSKQMHTLQSPATPQAIAETARAHGARSVAFTYNDPVIFLEYAHDTAAACRALGIEAIAVTAGYITDEARPEFFRWMSAANVDLKAFSEDFYRKVTSGHLQPVLDTLRYLVHETEVWTEVTTLLIPGLNDDEEELKALSGWMAAELGPQVPLHFSAFHPDYRMLNRPATPLSTLRRARKIAMQEGLHYVYTGNVHDAAGDRTCCPGCRAPLIERDWFELRSFRMQDGSCPDCGQRIPGRFEPTAGTWGRRRLPISRSEISKRDQPASDCGI